MNENFRKHINILSYIGLLYR